MKGARETITLSPEERMEFLDITKQIHDAVQKHPISDGIVLVNSLHTTVALFVNEYVAGAVPEHHLCRAGRPAAAGDRHSGHGGVSSHPSSFRKTRLK